MTTAHVLQMVQLERAMTNETKSEICLFSNRTPDETSKAVIVMGIVLHSSLNWVMHIDNIQNGPMKSFQLSFLFFVKINKEML